MAAPSGAFRVPPRRLELRIASSLALLAALALARDARAQVWNETGDAGDLKATAQVTAGSGALTAIRGNLDSPTDVDMYCIHVTDPAAFVACLQCVVIQGPNLWIFNSIGKGVAANTLCQGGCKNVTGALVTTSGTYYVAVGYDAIYPYSGANSIWNPAYVSQRAPDGPGAAGAVTSWSGTPNVQPLNPYQVSFSGVTYCSVPTSAPGRSWGRIKHVYR